MLKYFFISSLILLLINSELYGQSGPDFNSKIIPPSPAIATFQRYGDYPVDYSTGVPSISIPIYNIGLKDFSFPINISFHASGRRANFDFSSMGLGWVMNATGYISREIRERPDELYSGLETSTDQLNIPFSFPEYTNAFYYHLRPADMMIPNGPPSGTGVSAQDAEHDIFSYNVNGISGKFIIDKFQKIVPLNYTETKIEGSANGGFILTDKNGLKYFFNVNPNSNESVSMYVDYHLTSVINGWYLSKIVLSSGEVINYNYGTRYTASQGDNITSPFSSSTVLTYHDAAQFINGVGSSNGYAPGPHVTSYYNPRDYFICYLTNITFDTGKINFNYDNSTLLLQSVDVLNASNTFIQKSNFTYGATPGTQSNFPNNNSTSLGSVYQTDANGKVSNTYSFGYYGDVLGNSTNSFTFQTMADWWGYSNSGGNKFPNDVSMGQESVDVAGYGCANCKVADFIDKRSGMLHTITFPTGGNTEFIYEANRSTIMSDDGPGIRIQKIVSDDGTGINKLTKLYKYGENEDGKGILPYLPSTLDYRSDLYIGCWESTTPAGAKGSYRIRTYTTTPKANIAEAYQQPIYYTMVTEYTQSATGVNLGKTVFHYGVPQYEYSGGLLRAFRSKTWTSAKLSYKQVYKFDPSQNTYKEIEFFSIGYETLNYFKIPQIRMFRAVSIPFDDNTTNHREVEEGYWVPNIGSFLYPYPIYYVTDYPVEAAVEVPETETNIITDDAGQMTQTNKHYYYDNLVHIQPTRIETQTSRSDDKLITEIKYPDDFSTTSPVGAIWTGIADLKTKHIITPVEISKYRSSTDGTNKRLVSSSLFAYNPTIPVPDSILMVESVTPLLNFNPASIQTGAFVKDNNYKTRYIFDRYDNELNLLQKHQKNSINTTYLWSYNGQYPIAQITNATYSAIEALLGGASAVQAFRDNPNPSDAAVVAFLAPLRNQTLLPNVQVSTYTYNPLVGMTSGTDAKGLTSYYEYDSFQRLMNIKDKDGNIIKHTDYHYQGQ